MIKRGALFLGLFAAVFAPPAAFSKAIGQDCLESCHGEETFQNLATSASLYVDLTSYRSSVHGKEGLDCADCHHPAVNASHPSVDKLKADCAECHEKQSSGLKTSVHGKEGEVEPGRVTPVCADCHTSHNVLSPKDPEAPVNLGKIHLLCEGCHEGIAPATDPGGALARFRLSGHGKGDLSELYSEEMCLSCHQGSAVHGEENLTGQKCPACHLTSAKAENGEGFHFRTAEEASLLPAAMVLLYRFALLASVLLAAFFSGRKLFLKCAKKKG